MKLLFKPVGTVMVPAGLMLPLPAAVAVMVQEYAYDEAAKTIITADKMMRDNLPISSPSLMFKKLSLGFYCSDSSSSVLPAPPERLIPP